MPNNMACCVCASFSQHPCVKGGLSVMNGAAVNLGTHTYALRDRRVTHGRRPRATARVTSAVCCDCDLYTCCSDLLRSGISEPHSTPASVCHNAGASVQFCQDSVLDSDCLIPAPSSLRCLVSRLKTPLGAQHSPTQPVCHMFRFHPVAVKKYPGKKAFRVERKCRFGVPGYSPLLAGT